MEKTNALRLLDQKKIPYELFEYSVADGKIDAISVATKINQPIEQVYKTLVAQNEKKQYFVFILPAAKELDFKACARFLATKSIELIPTKDLLALTGYQRGGCSPVAMKKVFPTIVSREAEALETIIVSAGKIGLQMKVKTELIGNLLHIRYADITF